MNALFGELDKKSGNIFLIDEDNDVFLTYYDASYLIDNLARKLKSPDKKLAIVFCENNYKTVLSYLAVLKSGHAVLLLDNKLNDDIKAGFINIYRPEIIFSPGPPPADDYIKTGADDSPYYIRSKNEDYPPIYNQLGLLLSTSGTTGCPKLVRLSYKNVSSNAASIVKYLKINSSERAIVSLPMSYSYGLSVINSHLMAGASILMTDYRIIFKDFWKQFNRYSCTSFAGVPYSYCLLNKTYFHKLFLPSLRTLTQAGGRLNDELIKYFSTIAALKGIRFFVMYGQTEATARISYLPHELLPEKTGSIGIPIPGGRLEIICGGQIITEPGTTGELVYTGPNVMLGYAESRDDLAKTDELNGVLNTGDLGYKSEEGLFYITGRLNRFIKLFGLRLNLDEIEKTIETNLKLENACTGTDEKLFVLVSSSQPSIEQEVHYRISKLYNIKPSAISVKTGRIPLTSCGKKDYKSIGSLF